MASRPDVYRQLVERAATEAAKEQTEKAVKEQLTDIIDIPDPVAGTGLKSILSGRLTPQDLGKQAVNYSLGMVGIPTAVVGTVALVFGAIYAINQMNQRATEAFAQQNRAIWNNSIRTSREVLNLIENDITQSEFVLWLYEVANTLASDAEHRADDIKSLMTEARSTRPYCADTLIQMVKNPSKAREIQQSEGIALKPVVGEKVLSPVQQGLSIKTGSVL